MPRRHALALVRPQPLRLGLPHPSHRALAVTGAVVVLFGLVYFAARETSLLAVRSIEVTGAPSQVRKEVRAAAAPFLGESLVALDGAELERAVRSLPSVVSVKYDRDFPHGLRLVVVPERPVAVVRAGTDAWLVSARGRVIRAVERGAFLWLPRVWLPSSTELSPGEILGADRQGLAIRGLARLRAKFPATVAGAREREGKITLVLRTRQEVRLGDAGSLPLKLAVAESVLRSLASERARILYVDVSLPARPVAG